LYSKQGYQLQGSTACGKVPLCTGAACNCPGQPHLQLGSGICHPLLQEGHELSTVSHWRNVAAPTPLHHQALSNSQRFSTQIMPESEIQVVMPVYHASCEAS
jgi:hypothetical protein